MTRSFSVPATHENALMEGPIPEAFRIDFLKDLSNEGIFRGGNVVFLASDELVADLRSSFLELGVKNDIIGVREAKGLEFPSVAILGFFSYFENCGSARAWENVIRWLFSTKGITTTSSTEKFQGKLLESCDCTLSQPELEDHCMML
jgi:hypothetical protein